MITNNAGIQREQEGSDEDTESGANVEPEFLVALLKQETEMHLQLHQKDIE